MNILQGKSVVITGAGSGLGSAYARHAAGLGAAVVVNDIDAEAAQSTAESIVASGGKAVAHAGDISSWSYAQQLIDACIDAFGAITGIVNNAGILRIGKILDLTEADMRRMVEINLVGTAACASHAARRMLAAGRGGSIINVASGSQAGDVALGGYGATKGGVASLTYSWAMELRGTGLRVNALSPLAETAMAAQNKALMAEQAASREVHYAALPDTDVNAPVVSFLLSDAAEKINGQVVRIAGKQLSFVTHPLIADPVLEGDWSYEAVAAAFAGTLAANQQPLGLGYQRKPH
ncbi:short-subunit dehydrogenase [Aminobacter aminovorans]|jgi:NAD(P)-dependent dehydrogenase (short-subunit alcohol dehydrogenase family)|uniref:Sorbitol dehydrogenase n=1 Tax=Aminobacter aminovorans TaxID=83263 RepID=A0A380WLJ4_AMIAI|nr:SDR family oxidoreductase [Aminobacter aminovorans]TCS27668.1 short-subunit dehydrogenase [Aminobacter aminovorans]SUU89919.1 Sorbitol dehydrogenase [Aminobacter aminovorans]